MLTLPITPYRYFNGCEVTNNSRIVHGIEGMINDTASLQVMVQSIGRKVCAGAGAGAGGG